MASTKEWKMTPSKVSQNFARVTSNSKNEVYKSHEGGRMWKKTKCYERFATCRQTTCNEKVLRGVANTTHWL